MMNTQTEVAGARERSRVARMAMRETIAYVTREDFLAIHTYCMKPGDPDAEGYDLQTPGDGRIAVRRRKQGGGKQRRPEFILKAEPFAERYSERGEITGPPPGPEPTAEEIRRTIFAEDECLRMKTAGSDFLRVLCIGRTQGHDAAGADPFSGGRDVIQEARDMFAELYRKVLGEEPPKQPVGHPIESGVNLG